MGFGPELNCERGSFLSETKFYLRANLACPQFDGRFGQAGLSFTLLWRLNYPFIHFYGYIFIYLLRFYGDKL